ncbi:hypothetical protein IW152_001439 [Coemansia sp. BCRC 34962]|nr:hypothetical protein IW152_001439 [Coemansia sp. BCRC 34962]
MYSYYDPTPFVYNITFVPYDEDTEATRIALMIGRNIQVHTCPYEMSILDAVELHDFGDIEYKLLKFQYFRDDEEELILCNRVGEVANKARTTGSYVQVCCGDLDNRLAIVITYARKV